MSCWTPAMADRLNDHARSFRSLSRADTLMRATEDYARMLDSALEGFSETPDRDRYLIVLSDGELE